jgi:hypothetical protein
MRPSTLAAVFGATIMMTEEGMDDPHNKVLYNNMASNRCGWAMRHRRRSDEAYIYDWCYPAALVLLVLIFAFGGLSALHQKDTIKAYATGVFLLLFVFLLGASIGCWYYTEHGLSVGIEEAPRAQPPRVARQAEVGALTTGCDARRAGA